MDCYVTLCYEVEVSFDLYLRHFNKSTTTSRTSKSSEWSVGRIIEASKILLSKKCKADLELTLYLRRTNCVSTCALTFESCTVV